MSFSTMWSDLEQVGRASSGGYRRFAWTREDATLREWFAQEAARRGLDLTEDRAGNQWAWWGSPSADAPALAVGSHLDSVPDGGAFDGPLGVVSSLAAIDLLREQGFTPSRPVAVANFADEEGARFGVACIGSRVVSGVMPAEKALALRDADGTTMAQALRAAGRDPERLAADPDLLATVGEYVELHVEQGRGLVDLGRPVAVGTSIWPHGRWRLDLQGQANHAGTTRLEDRHDPMLALAAAILTARSSAEQHGCVATIGKTRVVPGGVNAIPSQVQAWIDARGPVVDDVRAVVADIAREVGVEAVEESWTGSTDFDPGLSGRVAALLDDAPMIGTGAGHDAGILATAGMPTAMLFVRNPTGISHSPQEHAEQDDCLAGVQALARVVADLTGTPEGVDAARLGGDRG